MLQLENTCLPLLFSSKRCQQDKIKESTLQKESTIAVVKFPKSLLHLPKFFPPICLEVFCKSSY